MACAAAGGHVPREIASLAAGITALASSVAWGEGGGGKSRGGKISGGFGGIGVVGLGGGAMGGGVGI
eukprot:4783975-Prymnesium_polylepis.2